MNSPAITVEQGIVTGGGTVVVSSANLYDDVLSERSRIRGVLTFRLRAAPDSFRTLIYTESDITIPTMLDGSILTMGVHQTLSLAHPWDYRTEAGTPLWSPLRFTRGFTDKGREFYRSDTTWMQVAGTLQLFEKHQAIDVALREFPVVFTLFETPPPNPVAGVP